MIESGTTSLQRQKESSILKYYGVRHSVDHGLQQLKKSMTSTELQVFDTLMIL